MYVNLIICSPFSITYTHEPMFSGLSCLISSGFWSVYITEQHMLKHTCGMFSESAFVSVVYLWISFEGICLCIWFYESGSWNMCM